METPSSERIIQDVDLELKVLEIVYCANGGAVDSHMRFSFSTPKEIARGLKRIWESKMETPSSARIIQDIDLELKVWEIVYCANGGAVEGMADRITLSMSSTLKHRGR